MIWYFLLLQVAVITAIDNSIKNDIHRSMHGSRDFTPNLIDQINVQSTGRSVTNDYSRNLQLLSNGALALPAEIMIRNRLYNVTQSFKFSPYYLGYASDDRNTAVVIRTNHILGWFNRPEVFIEQLRATEKSGLLMDFDIKHSILVLFEVKSLRENAKKLVKGELELPNYAMIGHDIFVINHQASKTEDYVQYFGHLKGNHSNRVTLKAYSDRGMYRREISALRTLDRLYDKDDKNMIAVSRHMRGYTLDHLLNNLHLYPGYIFKFLEDYIPTIQKFHLKFGLSHGNINSSNVFIRPDGSIELINFEYSRPFSQWSNHINRELKKHDINSAYDALKSQAELIKALSTPLDLDSQRFLWKYISDMGQIHGERTLRLLWTNIREKQIHEFEKSQDNSRKVVKHLSKDFPATVAIETAAKYLAEPSTIRLPFIITVGINQYKVTEYISTGAQGSVYRGFFVQDPTERVVIKIYKQPNPERHFNAEKFGLVVTGRLYDEDFTNLITVQKEIPGQLLSRWYYDQMKRERYTGTPTVSKEDLFKEITKLLLAFHSKWHLAHNDVRPDNIIRKPDGSLELIDFGYSNSLWTKNEHEYNKRIEKDFEIAQKEYEFFFDGLAVKNAFKRPSKDKLPIVRNFVDTLWRRGDTQKADNVWKDFLKLLNSDNK